MHTRPICDSEATHRGPGRRRVYGEPAPRLVQAARVALAGCELSISLELALTTSAAYLKGPVNLLDVSSIYSSFTLPFLVWAGGLTLSGIYALYQTLRLPHANQA